MERAAAPPPHAAAPGQVGRGAGRVEAGARAPAERPAVRILIGVAAGASPPKRSRIPRPAAGDSALSARPRPPRDRQAGPAPRRPVSPATAGAAPRRRARAGGLSSRPTGPAGAEALGARRTRPPQASPRAPGAPRSGAAPADGRRTDDRIRSPEHALLARRERPQGKSASRLCNLGIKSGSGRAQNCYWPGEPDCLITTQRPGAPAGPDGT